MPTSKQQDAIAVLRGVGLGRVLSWLEVVRAVSSATQQAPTHRRLSQQQLDALRAIESLPDDHIMAFWPSDAHTARSGKHRPPLRHRLGRG